MHVKLVFLLLIFAFQFPALAHAGEDRRNDCFSRLATKLPIEEYKIEIEKMLPPASLLMREAKEQGLWEGLIAAHHEQHSPKDTFCIFGEDVPQNNILKVLKTDGGNLFVYLRGDAFRDRSLVQQGLIDNEPLFENLRDLVLKEVAGDQRRSCNLMANQYYENLTGDAIEGMQEQCWDAIPEITEPKRRKFNREIAAAREFSTGEIVRFDYWPGNDGDNARSLAEFAARIQVQELTFEGAYQSTVERPLSEGFPGTEHVQSASQWISVIVEAIGRDATYSTAVGILDSTDDVRVEELTLPTITEYGSIYHGFVDDEFGNSLDTAVAVFVCSLDFKSVLSLSSRDRFWFNIDSFKAVLCGSIAYNGSNGSKISIFDGSLLVKGDPSELTTSLEFGQREEIQARLSMRLVELAEINLEQASLLNDLKELGATRQFKDDLERLQTLLRAAEEAARAPTVLEQVATVAQLGTSIGQFVGAAGGLTNLWSAMPDAPLEQRSQYLWEKTKELGEVGSLFGKSVNTIQSGFDEIERWLNRQNGVEEVDQLRAAVASLKAAFERVLIGINSARERYRDRTERASNDIQWLKHKLRGTETALATVVGEIVAFNVYAFLSADGGPQRISQCKLTLEGLAFQGLETTFQQLFNGCLRISNQVESRRECIESLEADEGLRTLASNSRVGLILDRSPVSFCF